MRLNGRDAHIFRGSWLRWNRASLTRWVLSFFGILFFCRVWASAHRRRVSLHRFAAKPSDTMHDDNG